MRTGKFIVTKEFSLDLDNFQKDTFEIEHIENINELNDKDLIMMLIKQNSDLIKENSEFKNIMIPLITAEAKIERDLKEAQVINNQQQNIIN